MSRNVLLRLAACLLAVWAGAALRQDAVPQPSQEDYEKDLRRFTTLFAAVEENYADPVEADKLMYQGAIPGMLRALDPYSIFFDPGQFHQLQEQQQARAEGFGTIVSVIPGRVVVLEAFTGGPAARGGILPGDEIVEINNHRIDVLEVQDLVDLLTETKKSTAQLRLIRAGSAALKSVTVAPAEIAQPSVDRVFFLEPGIGYIKLNAFEGPSTEEVHQAIEKLQGAGPVKSLVLDLRNNHGGLVDAAVAIAGFFLKPGTLVMSARGRAQKEHTYQVADVAKPYDFPVAVLVNNQTASAAEILAGALQDHHRAAIVGLQTFGKGIVQSVYPLSQGTGLALAAAQYFTPSGRSIQRPVPGLRFTRAFTGGGITPDIPMQIAGVDDWEAYVEARAGFLDFARLYVPGKAIDANFSVDKDVLEEFKAFLRKEDIGFTESIWSAHIPYVKTRLKVEIFNLALGVAKGDEVSASEDLQVKAAIAALSTSPK